MTCIEFVLSKLNSKESKELERLLTVKNEWMDKNELQPGESYIFVIGFHIGFGRLNSEHNLETVEYDEDKELRRLISLHDDNVKIAMKKEGLKLWEK